MRSARILTLLAALACAASASHADEYFFRANKAVSPPPLSLSVVPGLTEGGKPFLRAGANGTVSLDVGGAYGGARVSVQGLPPGMSFDGSRISGRPTAPGSYAVTVTVADADGRSGRSTSQRLVLEVAVPLSVTGQSTAFARVGGAISAPFAAQGARGTIQWSVSGALPGGIVISQDGVLGGTASTASSGTAVVRATDPFDGAAATRSIAVVAMSLPSVSGTSSISGSTGSYLTSSWSASGIGGSAAWSVSGSVPPGTSFSGGQVSGTPSSPSSGSFSVTVTDTLDGRSASRQVNYSIADASCALPWGGSVASGGSVQAFASASVPYNQSCQSQTRTCANGSLSGSYSAQSCTVSERPNTWMRQRNDLTRSRYPSCTISEGQSCSSRGATQYCEAPQDLGNYGAGYYAYSTFLCWG